MSGEPVFGIKGTTLISQLIDIPLQVPYDYMHLICQGHTKWILRQILQGSKHSDYFIGNFLINNIRLKLLKILFLFKLGNQINQINEILKSIKYPTFIHRKPLNIESFSKWKSSQIKIFILYTSVPIFLKYLPTEYFYLLASFAISIRLLYEPIATNTVQLADEMLNKYFIALEDSFGIYSYDFTAHALLHLANQVRNHGPLHCHSQFVFEVLFVSFI